MGLVGEERPMPGDIVLLRGSYPRVAWVKPHADTPGISAGHVMPGAMGLVVVSSHHSPWKSYAYVLWSCPMICGWTSDGFLRKV